MPKSQSLNVHSPQHMPTRWATAAVATVVAASAAIVADDLATVVDVVAAVVAARCLCSCSFYNCCNCYAQITGDAIQ